MSPFRWSLSLPMFRWKTPGSLPTASTRHATLAVRLYRPYLWLRIRSFIDVMRQSRQRQYQTEQPLGHDESESHASE